jgi:serine/threonine protein kinase
MQSTERCPKQDELSDFLVGNMNKGQIETLELHLSGCQACNETLRDLSSLDTFDFLAEEAFNFESSSRSVEDSNELASQIDDAAIELVRDKCKRWSESNPPGDDLGVANSSLLAARASEVHAAFKNEEGQDSLGIFGPFRIQKLLGAGSSGVVYLATDTNLDRQVALKILRPSLGDSAKARFLAEAKATAAMDHPHVVSIYQIGVESGMAFIAMKWAPGETLASRMASGEKMFVGKVRQIGSQIAAGLAAAHEEGLIHRDIKPANIWLEEGSDDVKILDFGLVRATNEEVSLTLTGMLAGTPCYMSPEQARGADLDARSDLFSLGCLLYQTLVGVLPFQGNNILAMLQAVQRDSPQHPHEIDGKVPRDLSALVMNLLQKSPDARPPKASVVSEAILSSPSQWQFTPTIKPKKLGVAGSKRKRFAWEIVALFAACVAGFYSPQIIRIATDHGRLVIETSDPDIKIEIVDSGGAVRVVDLKTEQAIDIKSGVYELRPISDENSVEINRETIAMKRGGKEIVRVVRNEGVDTDDLHFSLTDDTESDVSAVVIDPPIIGDDHLLQPGDIVGVYVEDLIEPNPTSGRLLYPLIINGGSELVHSEIDPIDVRGRKLGDLYALLRKSARNAAGDDVPLSARIEVQLLRKCPAIGELPDENTDVIPFSPSHSWQVMEALRSKERYRLSLLEEFGPRHPSVVVTNKAILETREFLQEVKFAEKRVLNEKHKQAEQLEKEVAQATLRGIESGGPKVFPEKNREIDLLHKELMELEKAQLVNDLNWILLQDQIPFGLNRSERQQYMQNRIDAIGRRAYKKTYRYSVELKASREKGWSEEHPRIVLLKHYLKIIPVIVANIASGELPNSSRALDKASNSFSNKSRSRDNVRTAGEDESRP